jgi:5-methylthioribose kinase
MIRRIVGIAHVEDLESIPDQEARGVCEKRSMRLARKLLVLKDAGCADIHAVVAAAYAERQDGASC